MSETVAGIRTAAATVALTRTAAALRDEPSSSCTGSKSSRVSMRLRWPDGPGCGNPLDANASQDFLSQQHASDDLTVIVGYGACVD